MKFHDDMEIAFKPLIDYLEDEVETEEIIPTVEQYMYMYHDDDSTYYKHFATRKYLSIDDKGKAKGQLEDWREWNE